MSRVLSKKITIASSVAALLLGGGVIVAITYPEREGAPSIVSEALRAGRCPDGSPERLSCLADLVNDVLKEQGLDAAYDSIVTFSKTEPRFEKYCHDITHTLGVAAYEIFANQKEFGDFQLTQKTLYCSFGFYHGFMETLVAKTGDFKKAKEFCAYVDKKLSAKVPNALLACYHGIGHGFAESQGEHAWKNEELIVSRSLKQCETITENKEHLYLCATGVFDSVAIAYYNHWYGLEMKKEDPLRICDEQPEEYKAPCFAEMMTAIIRLPDTDFSKAAKMAEKFAGENYASLAIRVLADTSIRDLLSEKRDVAEHVRACRALGASLRLPCVRGLGEGFLQFGQPEREYIDALSFCNSDILTESERRVCFQGVFFYAGQKYPGEKVKEICSRVDPQYREWCPRR